MTYGLIGKKLSHSYSKMIHNQIGNYDYRLLELDENDLDGFFSKRDFCAVNVTIPYKKAVIPFCDEISPLARKIGSVNTIVNRSGALYGYNTDYYGFLYMAKRAGIGFCGKEVIILGSGGTSCMAQIAALDEGAQRVTVISRNGEYNYDNLDRCADAQIIVNTTPVGMYPDNGKTLISLDSFERLEGVIDVIYNPLKTTLLLDAQKRNLLYTNGLSMLTAQAVRASELFFDTTYSEELTESIITEIENSLFNIILVGMPGSGKTSIGKAASALLGRTFIDTDEEIVRYAGNSIPYIFEHYGEEYFRNLESKVISELCAKTGRVIATGGGAPLREENRSALMQNGYICLIDRDLNKLDTKGRPLSKDRKTLREMYEKRLPVYRSICDIMINADDITKAARKLADEFYSRNRKQKGKNV